MKRFLAVLLKMAFILLLFTAGGFWLLTLPPRDVPWGPVHLSDEIGLFTGYKINHLKNDFPACQKALTRAQIKFTPMENKTNGFCEQRNRVNIEQSRYPYSAPVRADCALAAALVAWEENIVRPAAEKHLGQEIARIDHYGIYSCRRVNNSESGRPSQHAFARAIDISGFVLKDGTRISVLNDWGQGNDKARFLKDVHNNACQVFRGVLGPEYNNLHADHFHMDMGPYKICR